MSTRTEVSEAFRQEDFNPELMASLPREPFPYTVERITPVSEARDGRNSFRVEARLDRVSERLRPGMDGVAKTLVDRRLVICVSMSFRRKLLHRIQ